MTASATTCDTSVLVAALVTWHPRHTRARRAVAERVTALPAHVLIETYSVLTRLPAPHRLSAAVAGEAVTGIDLDLLTLPAPQQVQTIGTLARREVRGGAAYDGLVAATARHHDATLLTSDRRAARTYQTLGVAAEWV